MFEAEILQAEDMLERMEAEAKLSSAQREALPGHQRVLIDEAVAWQREVERKLKESFSPDTFARYELIGAQHSREIDNRVGDELSRHINRFHRIVRLLRQLDKVPNAVGRAAPPPTVETKARTKNPGRVVKRYDVFISHASEDKATVATPLFEALKTRGLSVWFDDAVLELGDSLRRKIDDGLARSKFGVVILSPSFLAKEWPQRELDGLVARETISGEKAILPVWHDLSPATLAARSPLLADRLSVKTSLGIDAVAEKIAQTIKKPRRKSV